jgi:carbamoyltransferase
VWLNEKLRLRSRINERLGRRRPQIIFLDHHESHAASAFFPSPYERAAILTVDGVGEWSTTALGVGEGNRIHLTQHLRFPHSLGLLYSAFTAYCGFAVNDGEYKLMGLAPYGRPTYAADIRRHLIDLKGDGSFRLNLDYFRFGDALTMTSGRFHRHFGGPPRRPDEPIEQRHMDLAASVQSVLEEALLRIAAELHRRTGQDNLVMAAGVALNCVANGRLLREGPFHSLWVQPAAGDAGGALGAALFVWHQLLGQPRTPEPDDSQQGSFLGPHFSSMDIVRFLQDQSIAYRRLADEERFKWTAAALEMGKIVGWFAGRMEFGPRALGARSILADARRADMQSIVNQKIKFREGFRPFAPAVLAEHAAEWFDGPVGPYMLLVAGVRPERRVELSAEQRWTMTTEADLHRRAAIVRSTIPAVTHVDASARVQSVDARRNPTFHALLSAFYQRTGCPVLLNTSFNVRGEPIVCTPADALRCFRATGMDILVMEDCVIEKPPPTEDVRRALV